MPVPGLAAQIARSADPGRVEVVVDRLGGDVEGLAPAAVDAVVAVAGASNSLGELICTDPAALAVLTDLDSPVHLDLSSPDALARSHRLARLRIAARDLLGMDSLDETVTLLSELATDALRGCLDLAAADTLAVVGMGKLGAGELNYVSDVDIVFVSGGELEHDARSARRFLGVAGRCFTVDTALRPGGRDGALVRSVDGYLAHWARWADAWEFQALLKARALVGPAEVLEAFSAASSDALWGRPFGSEDLRELRRMKARAEAEVAARVAAQRGSEVDVKRAPGGIRDIEFSVQLLQLVHGGADESLRVRPTTAALDALVAGGYVDAGEARTLADAYRFFRRVEHRLQLVQERQTHDIPADRARRRRIARTLGYRGVRAGGPTEQFDHDLTHHRLTVRRIHEGWYFRPLLHAFAGGEPLPHDASAIRLEAFGFRDTDRTGEAVRELSSGLTRSSRLMRQLLPLVFDWLSQGPDPDLGLLGLRRLASGQQATDALVHTFRDSAETAQRLCALLTTTPIATQLLVANPDLVDRLDDADALRTGSRDELVDSAWRSVGWRGAVEESRAALRRWHRRQLVGVLARDVAAISDQRQVGEDLTALAETVIETALRLLRPSIPVAVIGMGRAGGRELAYASDLDLVVVFDGAGADDAAEAERAAAGLLRLVGGTTPADRILEVDADLRPEGRQGPLARSLDSYTIYLDRWAEVWERQALLRARAIAGDPETGRAFASLVEHTLWNRPPSDDDVRAVRRMKARMEAERIPRGIEPRRHLKLGPGGLSDIEWTVQLSQWERGVHRRSTSGALVELGRQGAISADDVAQLADALDHLEVLRNRLWLVTGQGDVLPEGADQLATVARALDMTSNELVERHRRLTRRCRAVVERCFYGGPLSGPDA